MHGRVINCEYGALIKILLRECERRRIGKQRAVTKDDHIAVIRDFGIMNDQHTIIEHEDRSCMNVYACEPHGVMRHSANKESILSQNLLRRKVVPPTSCTTIPLPINLMHFLNFVEKLGGTMRVKLLPTQCMNRKK